LSTLKRAWRNITIIDIFIKHIRTLHCNSTPFHSPGSCSGVLGSFLQVSWVISLTLALILDDKNLIGRGLLLQVLELVDREEDWSKLSKNKTVAVLVTESSN